MANNRREAVKPSIYPLGHPMNPHTQAANGAQARPKPQPHPERRPAPSPAPAPTPVAAQPVEEIDAATDAADTEED